MPCSAFYKIKKSRRSPGFHFIESLYHRIIYASVAVCVMAVDVSVCEIGQVFAAVATHSWNLSLSIPGTFAVTMRCDASIRPFSRFRVTSQRVSRLSGVNPAAPSTKLSFIVKQPACAAATSSSGLVPTPSSKRLENEYCVWFSVVDCVDTWPFPSLPDPSQCAVA